MLCGYTNVISLSPGSELTLHVSTDRPAFNVEVVRLLHGDPSPAGPGFQEEKLAWVAPGPYPGRVQTSILGSYATLPPPTQELHAFTFAFWVCPTAPMPCRQTLWSWQLSPSLHLELNVNESWNLVATLTDNGQTQSVELARRLFAWRWHYVGLGVDFAGGRMMVFNGARGTVGPSASRASIPPRPAFRSDQPMLLAASATTSSPRPAYNGKIGHPILLEAYPDGVELCQLQAGMRLTAPDVYLSEWDLSRDITTDRIIDTSPAQRHGRLHNTPGRAVTGHLWTGPRSKLYTDAPHEYDAAHFHDDDLTDAKWQPSLSLRVPPDARSGIYAARLTAEGEPHPWWLTFVVNKSPASAAPILYVVPTLTWHAYANYADRDLESRFGPSLYTSHHDATSPCYISLLKPVSSLHPSMLFPPHPPGAPGKPPPSAVAT